MNTAYPAPLQPGSRIAVTAPSSGVAPPLHARLDLCLAHLRTQGFVVEEGACLRDEQRSASASADARAAELQALLLRDDIDAVIPPWGGELAIELLDRLDWPALAAAKPKWALGYSDSSTWMLPLTLRLNWATAHGPCLMDLVPNQQDALTRGAMAVLATAPGGSVTQHASDRWQLHWADFAHVPDGAYNLTERTHWRRLDGAAQDTHFAGRLIGGCIDTLMLLAGSPYGNVAGFITRHRADGVVLFLENAEQSPTAFVRALHALRWAGWLDGLAGVLIGRSAAPDSTAPDALRYADALQQTLGGLPCPVLVDVDIGHLPPQLVLVNGALAHVQCSADGRGWIEQRFT